jgi:beta-mannosidase
VHGEGLYEYNINFRRRMSEFTSASIFWMYNACWPETRSWGTIDYFGRRTPAFWPVKRSFAPVAAEFVDAGESYDIYGISDLLTDTPAKLSYGYMLTSGEIKLTTVEVTVKANDSVVVARLPKAELPEGAIPVLELEVEGAPLFRRRFIDKEHKLIGLEKTDIRVVKNGDGTATYTADKPVFGVCLDLDGDDGELSDNYFDLFPGRPYTVKLGSKSGDVLYSYMGQPEA